VANRKTKVRKPAKKVLTIFGTRPEVIKLAPVIQQLEAGNGQFQTVNVSSGQHSDLFYPLVRLFGVRIDRELTTMEAAQTPNRICSRVLPALEPILVEQRPDLILVQGDTTTAMAGALAGFYQRIPVGHVEAGMRSGNVHSPFPEEINRQLIARLATAASHAQASFGTSEDRDLAQRHQGNESACPYYTPARKSG
jgi:UDP-N-acetylglucosamine 2-epimerase